MEQIEVNGLTVDIVRKEIKNLHLGVYPPDGRVRVAAPFAVSDEAVRHAVIARQGWICKQQERFALQERQSPREMIDGESHYFAGQRYRLKVINGSGPSAILLCGKTKMELHVSPDGKEVVYTVTEAKINGEMNAYITQIWKGKVEDFHSHIQYTTGEKSSSYPRWSPNGQWVAFLSSRSGVNNLFLISPEGGDAVQLTNVKDGVETFRWSPDSSTIAFITKNEDQPYSHKQTGLSNEVEIYSKKQKVSQLFVIEALPALQAPVPVTTSDYNLVGEIDFHTVLEAFDWSPDSKKIAFTYTSEVGHDSRWKNSQIAIVDVHSKVIEKLSKIAPHQSIPRFSPDGKFLAFLKSDDNSSYGLTRNITLYSLPTKQFRELQKTPDESPFLIGPSLLGWSSYSREQFKKTRLYCAMPFITFGAFVLANTFVDILFL